MRLPFVFALAILPFLSPAQTPEVPGFRFTKPPVIDGTIGADEWAGAPSMVGGFEEQTGLAEENKTEYWFGYDDTFIYFACGAFDPDPKSIKAQEYRTNVSLRGDDYVGFFLDPFGAMNGPANQFEMNPRGATNPRIAGGRAAKREWLGEILAKGRITDTGYEIEARIPWAVMRLPSAGKRDMRVGAYRIEQKTGRAYLITDITGGHSDRIPIWRGIETPRIKADTSIKLLPYTYLGYDKKIGTVFNSGLDLKTQTPGGIDIVGSVNPDFRNIENQVLSLDFSYFDRLAAESRPFFLEGANFFQTSQDSPLFASQVIGSFDVGAKAFGKITDNTTIATLDTATFNKENDFVGLVRHAFDINTTLIGGVTHQDGNLDPGLRGNKSLSTFLSFDHAFGPIDAFGQYMTSNDDTDGNGHRFNSGIAYQKGVWNGFGEYVEITPNFDLRLGFAPEKGFKGFDTGIFRTDYFSKGALADNQLQFMGTSWDNYSGGGSYKKQISANDSLGFRNNFSITFGGLYRELFGFRDHLYSLQLANPRNDPYRGWSLNYDTGEIAGHSYRSIAPAFKYRPKRNFQLSASYQAVQHIDNINQLIFSANYDLNAFDSIAGRMVQTGGHTNGYLAFRRTGNKGNEYYLILGDPNAEEFRFSLIAKAVFPMNIKF
jgi:hypothetical protein